MFRDNERGFSLVEMMVVVAIIGILAAIGIPKYQQFKAKAVQAQAVESLGSIYKLNQIYFSQHEIYVTETSKFDELGFEVGKNQKYSFELGPEGSGFVGFVATATSIKQLASCAADIDVWKTDAENNIQNTTKGLKGCEGVFSSFK